MQRLLLDIDASFKRWLVLKIKVTGAPNALDLRQSLQIVLIPSRVFRAHPKMGMRGLIVIIWALVSNSLTYVLLKWGQCGWKAAFFRGVMVRQRLVRRQVLIHVVHLWRMLLRRDIIKIMFMLGDNGARLGKSELRWQVMFGFTDELVWCLVLWLVYFL